MKLEDAKKYFNIFMIVPIDESMIQYNGKCHGMC
jgi:hypothetical protein